MKLIAVFILILSFIVSLTGCRQTELEKKEKIFSLVEENYDAIVTACENGDIEALYSIDGTEFVNVNVYDGYIIVLCAGYGIAPSSQDYGFYYSPEGLPAAIDCCEEIIRYSEDLSPEGNGFGCTVDYNTFYTEHIKGNIYFYKNAY